MKKCSLCGVSNAIETLKRVKGDECWYCETCFDEQYYGILDDFDEIEFTGINEGNVREPIKCNDTEYSIERDKDIDSDAFNFIEALEDEADLDDNFFCDCDDDSYIEDDLDEDDYDN